MLIQTVMGRETFPTGTTKIGLFWRQHGCDKEAPIIQVSRDPKGGVRQISFNKTLANGRSDINGFWMSSTYDIPEYSYLKVWIQTRRGTAMFAYRVCSLLLRPRDNAAFNRVRIPFTAHDKAVLSCGYIEGRMDLIFPDRFEEFGVEVEEQYIDQYHPENSLELVTVEVVEREVSPLIIPKMRTIKTASGKKLRIPKVRRIRNIKL